MKTFFSLSNRYVWTFRCWEGYEETDTEAQGTLYRPPHSRRWFTWSQVQRPLLERNSLSVFEKWHGNHSRSPPAGRSVDREPMATVLWCARVDTAGAHTTFSVTLRKGGANYTDSTLQVLDNTVHLKVHTFHRAKIRYVISRIREDEYTHWKFWPENLVVENCGLKFINARVRYWLMTVFVFTFTEVIANFTPGFAVENPEISLSGVAWAWHYWSI